METPRAWFGAVAFAAAFVVLQPPAVAEESARQSASAQNDPHEGTVNSPRVTWPTVIREVKPHYTEAAMRARIEGEVVLEARVTVEGTVDRCRIQKSLDREHGLDQEAERVARLWLFKPATLDGKPVSVVAQIIIAFNLRDTPPKSE
jgi:TonB family protein